jgi:hypothetical protein
MQVYDLPPNWDGYPYHAHDEGTEEAGQEEVYIPLAGSATLVLDGDEHVLQPGTWARVGISQPRRLIPGPEGLRVLTLGGTPGKAFVPPGWTELGAAPPSMPE